MCLNIKAKKEDCFNKLEISACKRNIKIRNDFYIQIHILFFLIKKMRPPGLEPGSPTWKVRIIPLDHGRLLYLFK